jgi:hypothetical protein
MEVQMLKNIKLAVVMGVFLIFSANAAIALDFGVGAGVFIPGSDMKDFDPGIGANAYISKNIFPALIDLRLSANYYKTSSDTTDFSSLGGQLSAILAPPVPLVKPYVGLGYGIYNNKSEYNGTSKDEWGHGVVAKAGVGIEVVVLRIGLDAQYLINNFDNVDHGGYTVGLSFSLGF